MDLENLIKKAQQGEKDAFGEIYLLFYKKIWRFIYYLIMDKETASDFTQNTFIKLWNCLPSFNVEKGSLQAYIFTIARNLVIDESRKKKESLLDEALEIPSKEDLEENLERKEAAERVQKALEGLGGDEKQIIILRYFEDLSFAEISGILKTKEGALRVRVHRILEKLKKELKDEF